jgi:hypothetical protein
MVLVLSADILRALRYFKPFGRLTVINFKLKLNREWLLVKVLIPHEAIDY